MSDAIKYGIKAFKSDKEMSDFMAEKEFTNTKTVLIGSYKGSRCIAYFPGARREGIVADAPVEAMSNFAASPRFAEIMNACPKGESRALKFQMTKYLSKRLRIRKN